ncbi:MAG: hypothetical protein NDJ19_08275 [Ramlibacter sp.]|nr:hypothetical protein [Ramlibacter sp.]
MNTSTKSLLASAGVLVLTVVHHFYAAAIYDTPWRRHVAIIVVPMLLVMIALYGIYRWRPRASVGRASLWGYMLVALAVPVAWIGFFDGGYTHLAKLLVFYGGASPATFERLCPPELCGVPDDLLYEATGVGQFVLAVYAAYCLARLWRENRFGRSALPA